MRNSRSSLLFACIGIARASGAEIDRIWLTHGRETPETVVVNWESAEPGNAVVEYGDNTELGKRAEQDEKSRLHHVEIPLGKAGVHYRVRTGIDASLPHFTRGYSGDELRVAVVADTGYAKRAWASAVLATKPDLLLMAGDHVPALHTGTPVPVVTTTAFSNLVAGAPELFRSIRILPLLGNHDREIRPRGPKPPPEPVYDVDATAFREFFALPGEEWRWHFEIPDFGVRFVALDLNHIQDQGTTWQTCHSATKEGPQFGWYREVIAGSAHPFVITLFNEKSSVARGLEKGEWGRMIQQGAAAITGFGYFAERAEVDGFPYFNTAVSGTGDKYPDPKSAKLVSQDNFLLLRFQKGKAMQVEMRSLEGEVLDTREIPGRARK